MKSVDAGSYTTPCSAEDPELFFPSPKALDQYGQAQTVCGGCALRTACHQYAVETRQPDGVWGGEKFGEKMRTPGKTTVPVDADGHPVGVDVSRFTARLCRSGKHEFTPENTRWTVHHGVVSRSCRACRSEYRSEQRAAARVPLAA